MGRSSSEGLGSESSSSRRRSMERFWASEEELLVRANGFNFLRRRCTSSSRLQEWLGYVSRTARERHRRERERRAPRVVVERLQVGEDALARPIAAGRLRARERRRTRGPRERRQLGVRLSRIRLRLLEESPRGPDAPAVGALVA